LLCSAPQLQILPAKSRVHHKVVDVSVVCASEMLDKVIQKIQSNGEWGYIFGGDPWFLTNELLKAIGGRRERWGIDLHGIG
jgi:hypothetical protein